MLTICKLGTVHTLNFAQCFDDSVVNLRAFEPSASRRAEMGRECPGGSRGQRHDCDFWRPVGGRGGGRREASEFMVISELTGGSESCRGQDLENCLLKSVPGAPGGTLFPQRRAELAPLLLRFRRSSWFNSRKIVVL